MSFLIIYTESIIYFLFYFRRLQNCFQIVKSVLILNKVLSTVQRSKISNKI